MEEDSGVITAAYPVTTLRTMFLANRVPLGKGSI